MCRMAGFSSSDGLRIARIIDFTKHMANYGMESPHNDGWGIIAMNDEEKIIFKSIKPIYKDSKVNLFSDNTIYTLGIVHARLASAGLPKTTLQLHPFYIDGKYFAHNGTIKSAKRENIYSSDTYEYFENIALFKDTFDLGQKIKDYAQKNEYSGMNFLMIDEIEKALYVCCLYTDSERNREYFTLHYYNDDADFIVYSEKFSNDYKSMENGELIKVVAGKIVDRLIVL
ncbi:putative glutamine amidotransferase [Fervidobacterium pennivorans DSM 9078]|uniref:Glutamine amidotransferase n=1 Tax=Fervidobacterium pennivorans (strain DSM 9078 / Ven5) TaxID=771875 RepID=H9UB19_FERPD|nr:class II glutamine amidotransferase [Fervidobacterium pennivorans]AFG34712.1 putative glutamine amidotransferase [Fervidobacterium pennivorans DSM 9078]